MEPTRLFSEYELHDVLEEQRSKIRELAANIPAEFLLSNSLDESAEEAVKELRVEPIEFVGEISVEQIEAKVDVSRDPMRYISDRGRPSYIDGIKLIYHVPFTGDSQLFRCRPTQFSLSSPYAGIRDGELLFEYSVTDGDIMKTKPRFEKDLNEIRKWIGWQREQVDRYNASIATEARPLLEFRLKSLTLSQTQFADLGFKVHTKPEPAKDISAKTINNQSKSKSSRTDTATKKYDVALSFAGEDREYVESVAEILRSKGVVVFYDRFEKVDMWGRNLVDHLSKVYEHESRFIVMFVSEHYALKSWPNHERKSAQARAVKMQEDCILPARFDDTEIPGMPTSISYVDLRSTSLEELATMIVEKLQN